MCGDVYGEECIFCCVVLSLRNYHADDDFVFRPCLTSSHYRKDTVALFCDRNIRFVPKDANLLNVPTEIFMSTLKSKIYITAVGQTNRTSAKVTHQEMLART